MIEKEKERKKRNYRKRRGEKKENGKMKIKIKKTNKGKRKDGESILPVEGEVLDDVQDNMRVYERVGEGQEEIKRREYVW